VTPARIRLSWLAVVALALPSTADASTYLTLQFGRSTIIQAKGSTCTALPNTVDIFTVAAELKRRSLTATTVVNTGLTQEHARTCAGRIVYASWDDLVSLHANDGWQAISAGGVLTPYPTLTDQQVLDDSCGTLPLFRSHGFTRAWGEFGYPNNQADSRTAALVSSCFAFGRRYGTVRNALPITNPNWFVKAYSINGGRCNDPQLPCYQLQVVKAGLTYVYTSPNVVAALANGPDASWTTLQAYRFVTGSYDNGHGTAWDCSASDWHAHWSTVPELYCYSDYLSVLNQLQSRLLVTDPATVAALQGRSFS
jgi:hypothetical protein